MLTIHFLSLEGYRSIAAMIGMTFRPMNVLVGANGAGKSNLAGFLHLLHELAGGRLQRCVDDVGSADPLFFQGVPKADMIRCELRRNASRYRLILQASTAERLTIVSEHVAAVGDA